MTRILVTPSLLDDAANRFTTQAEALRSIANRLSSAIFNLEGGALQSRALDIVLDEWQASRHRFLEHAEQLEDMGAKLRTYARRFEDADQTSLTSITALLPMIAQLSAFTSEREFRILPIAEFPPEYVSVEWWKFRIPDFWPSPPIRITPVPPLNQIFGTVSNV